MLLLLLLLSVIAEVCVCGSFVGRLWSADRLCALFDRELHAIRSRVSVGSQVTQNQTNRDISQLGDRSPCPSFGTGRKRNRRFPSQRVNYRTRMFIASLRIDSRVTDGHRNRRNSVTPGMHRQRNRQTQTHNDAKNTAKRNATRNAENKTKTLQKRNTTTRHRHE